MSVPASERYLLEEQIPTGALVTPRGAYNLTGGTALAERRLDDCYTALTGPIEVDWGRIRLRISVECPEPHVMVHTPPQAFCIEPQTCAPDAFNLDARGFTGVGAATATPGRPVSIASRWDWDVSSS
ncbi:MAG: hypothetical protein ABI939_07725 [Anaerolineaceae bacterium]